MARNTQARRQYARPAPQPELTPSNAKAVVEIGGKVAKAGKPNLFELRAANKSSDIARKTTLLSTAAQGLAEAADIMAKSGRLTSEARNIAEREALRLYQGRCDGDISPDEVTETLGNVFGRKPLTSGPKAGQPGRTPAGLGEEIRKRIVRAVDATQFVTGEETGRYFADVPPETAVDKIGTVADIVQSLDNKARSVQLRLEAERALASADEAENAKADGLLAQATQLEADAVTLWTAYDYFARVKTAAADSPVAMAFDPTKLARLVEQLSVEGAVAKVKASEELMDAYAAIYNILQVIGQPDADEAPASE